MSRWPQHSWRRPSAWRHGRRLEFCCRLKAGAAERATGARFAVRRGFQFHGRLAVIEADLGAFSPGRVAAHDGHGQLAEGKRAL